MSTFRRRMPVLAFSTHPTLRLLEGGMTLILSAFLTYQCHAPLAQALAMHPREFDPLYLAVVDSGEQSGRLAQVLVQLANDLHAANQMRAKLLSASLYPAIVSGVALLIVVFLLAYLVPQVAQVAPLQK